MGCGPSMPKLDEFLVAVPAPASGFMLGDIASTAEGSVTLRFPCGVTIAGSNFAGPEPPATCPVKDENEKLLFTVYRAGAEPKSTFSPVKPLRKPTVVRDPAGTVIAMLQTDATEPAKFQLANSYTGYSARPCFAGQPASVTVEGVPLYPWFKAWNGGNPRHPQLYLHGPAGLEKPHAYQYTTYGGAFMPPHKFTIVSTGADKAGVAYGVQLGGNVQSGGRHEVTTAKGMDAGLVATAAFCPLLLEEEWPNSGN